MKFALALLALALTGASAFMGPKVAHAPARSAAVSMSYDKELGVQKPLGYWDPLNLLEGAPQERFDRLRHVELKHGRIAMLAVLGQIVTKAGIRLPGDIDYEGTHFTDIGTGWDAWMNQVPDAGKYQILALIFFLEVGIMKDQAGSMDDRAAPGEFPGDFRNGYIDFGWDKLSDADKLKKRSVELNNGRAAQMGILALMVHEQLGVSIWPGGI